jgi:T5SS/PEP-CTERM-associated repeat protein
MKRFLGVALAVLIVAHHGFAAPLINGNFEATAVVGAGQSSVPAGGSKILVTNPLDPGYPHSISGIPNWINSFEPAGWRDAGLARLNFAGGSGSQFAFINNWETRLSQVSGVTLGPGDTIQADILVGFDGPSKAGKFQLWAGTPNVGAEDSFPGSAVLLTEVSVGTPDWTNYVANETFAPGQWNALQVNYTAPLSGAMIGQPLTVSFLTSGGSAGPTFWDNASLTTTLGPNVATGTSNLWLAGMPNGSTSSFDTAPNQSPSAVRGVDITPGAAYVFSATGMVSNGPDPTPLMGPEGGPPIPHEFGVENGIGVLTAPINSLVGMFLGPDQPSLTAAPSGLNFTSAASRDFAVLSPLLKQPFFIGDGLTSTGDVQLIVAPEGATRLFLGAQDGSGWFNNVGHFEVDVAPNLFEWDNPAGGQFEQASNWDVNRVPTALSQLSFNIAGSYGVSYTGNASSDTLVVRQGNVLLNVGPHKHTTTREAVVGDQAGDVASLTIAAGELASASGEIARTVGSQGQVTVSGVTSRWSVGSNLNVGGADASTGGTGGLAVANQGAVTVGNVLRVWPGSEVNVSGAGRVSVGDAPLPAAGTVHIGAGGVVTGGGSITGDVVVDGGSGAAAALLPGYSTGTLTINGNLTQATNSGLEIEVGGVTGGTHDMVAVTGNAAIEGQLDVPIVNGYVPQAGDSVTILTAANVTGQFSALSVPDLQTANPNVAVGINQSATGVQVQFVAPITTTQFVANNPVTDWTSSSAWNTGVEPDSRHVITIENPMAPNQVVNVEADDAIVHDLLIKGNSTHQVTLNVKSGRSVSATVDVRAVRATVVASDVTRIIAEHVDLTDGSTMRGRDLQLARDSKKARLTSQINGTNSRASREVTLASKNRNNRRITAAIFPHSEPETIGSLVAPGLLTPGEEIGRIEVYGDYEQDEESAIEMEIASLASFDKFVVTNDSTLAGFLKVSFLNSFAPQAGDSFDLFDWGTVAGDFDVLQLPALAVGLTWNTNALYTLGTLGVRRQGDYDVNGVVDGADFLAWQRQAGASVTAFSGADGNGDGVVGAADLTEWRTHFGAGGGPGVASVPEPQAAVLVLLAIFGSACCRRTASVR